MEYAVMAQEKPFGYLFKFNLEICPSVHFVVTHQFVNVCYRTQWKINVNAHILTKKQEKTSRICVKMAYPSKR